MSLEPGTHSLCDACFKSTLPYNRRHVIEPTRSPQAGPLPCCICAITHTSGIFVRRDPVALPCKGQHA